MNLTFPSSHYLDAGPGYDDADRNFTGIEITYLIEELETNYGFVNAVEVEIDGDCESFTTGKFQVRSHEAVKYAYSGQLVPVMTAIDQTSTHWADVDLCRAINAYIEKHSDEIIKLLCEEQDASEQ